MLIKGLYILLIVSAVAVIGAFIAGWVRVRRHMAKPPDQTTVFRKRDPQ